MGAVWSLSWFEHKLQISEQTRCLADVPQQDDTATVQHSAHSLRHRHGDGFTYADERQEEGILNL